MSKIVLLVDSEGAKHAQVVHLLAKALSVSLQTVQTAISDGSPVVERELFDRNAPNFPLALDGLLQTLDDLGAHWRVFELPASQTYQRGQSYFQLSVDSLRAIVRSHDEGLAHQRLMGELEDEA